MPDVANPPRPRTHNAVMTAQGWGTIYCRVMAIGHGISIVSSSSKSRKGRSLYITKRTSGSFGATFLCTSFEEYVAFGKWIEGYGNRLVDQAPDVGPVRLICPSRNFDKVAIPSGVSFGDNMEPTHSIAINFMGARDSIPLSSSLISSFTLPRSDPSAPYYYPGGTQLTAGQTGADSMFDVPPAPAVEATASLNPGTGSASSQRAV